MFRVSIFLALVATVLSSREDRAETQEMRVDDVWWGGDNLTGALLTTIDEWTSDERARITQYIACPMMALAVKEGKMDTYNGGHISKFEVDKMLKIFQSRDMTTIDWGISRAFFGDSLGVRPHTWERTGWTLNIFSFGSAQQHPYHTGIRATIPSVPIEDWKSYQLNKGDMWTQFDFTGACAGVDRQDRVPTGVSVDIAAWQNDKRNCQPGSHASTFRLLAEALDRGTDDAEWTEDSIQELCPMAKSLFYGGNGWPEWSFSLMNEGLRRWYSQNGAGLPALSDVCGALTSEAVALIRYGLPARPTKSDVAPLKVTTQILEKFLVNSELPPASPFNKILQDMDPISCDEADKDEPCNAEFAIPSQSLMYIQSATKANLLQKIVEIEES